MSNDNKKLKLPSKRKWLIVSIVVVIAMVVLALFGTGIGGKGKNVDFEQIPKADIPKAIETEVIPEYRELERALGCLIDGKVYVVVTRGEKPTSGYGVSIEKMIIEKENNKNNLKVEAFFSEPEEGVSQSQVTTYPCAVALTKLTSLPDSIELIVKY